MPSKRAILADYAKAYNLKTFVETGTCDGGTLAAMVPLFDRLYSIDLDSTVYLDAKRRFVNEPKVTLIHGNSAVELPKLLPSLEGPVLFWLDAHDAEYQGPIVQELSSIFASNAAGVILIDDMDYITDILPVSDNWVSDGRDFGIVRLIHSER